MDNRTVSGLHSVSPEDIEWFHLWMLLFLVPGAKSFEELQSYDSIMMNSFQEAYHARNLLEDDAECQKFLMEVCNCQMPAKLRQLLSFICVFCIPTSPLELSLICVMILCSTLQCSVAVSKVF